MEKNYKDIEIFNKNLSNLKETSKDTDSGTIEYMTESETEVVNFDAVKNTYITGMKLTKTPCSTDALYIDNSSDFYFIEFKNGKMSQSKIYNVYNKIYDSLLIFNDIISENISFCREHVNFILVYNESKNPKVEIGEYFAGKAKKKFVRFDLEQFEKIYFKGVYTCTEQEFKEKFSFV